ncbi:membrane protein insertase YidC [Sphingomonas sp.]|uniref:membrane protein insertase YidC n=1 Tax=Sphingomonas sp. TaxID=28214 RepID=UPI0035BBC7D2
MTEDRRNFVLFAVIAALILFGFPLVQQRFFPTANPPVTRIEDGKTKVLPKPEAGAVSTTPTAIRDRQVVLRETPRVRIATPSLAGSINLKGGRIDDLVLTTYKETIAKNSPPIRLLSPSGAPDAYFAGFGWSGDAVTAPGADTVFTVDAPVLTPARPVTLSWTSPQGLRFALRIAVDDKFLFTVRQSVGNGGAAPVTVRPYALLSRTGVSKDATSWTNHVGPIGVFDNGANYHIDYANLEGNQSGVFARVFGNASKPGDNYFDARGGWLGFADKYWLAALAPDQSAQVHSGFRGANGTVFQADVAQQPRTIAPGKVLNTTTRVFAGAKEVKTLDRYEAAGIPLLGRAIDWGWFEIVEKPIFTYLDWLFRMVGNFGVAIILLTVTIRGLMFPIAQRQFASMAKMRSVQPKMKALQERYKDDKVKQQQEVMALYKAEKVNPLAGCLPTLLQIPIFYALYKVLMLTIEMRHQPFVGWIKDLSAPDPLTPVNLFGLLAFTPPHFLAIGVVPIVLGISMYFQFKLNPQVMDETQRQVFAILPWVLMFVMAPFAVGLQVYWITSNCLAILQQRLLYARHPELAAAPAK